MRTLLFLRNLEEIEYEIDNDITGVYLRENKPEKGLRRIAVIGQQKNNEIDEQWIVFSKPISETAGNLNVEIAFKLGRDKNGGEVISKLKQSYLNVFFPTEKETHLGFLVQGPYQTTPARDNIPQDNKWNEQLVEETAELLQSSLQKLKKEGLLTVNLLETLPIEVDAYPDNWMFWPLYESTRQAFVNNALLPTASGDFVKASNAKLARGKGLRELIAEGITKDTISDYLENRREASGNIAANRDLKDLKALYNWAFKQEYLIRNPCLNFDNYPEERTIRYVPPAKDINKVLMTAEPDDMDLLMVLYHTAGRIGEVFKLTWEDINFEKRWIRLYTRKRRGGELQEDKLAMTDTIFDILKKRWKSHDKSMALVFSNKDGAEFSYSHKRNLMSRLCKKAGVKPFGFHAIRHHVASILGDSGKASLGQIQRLLRHKRSTTTDNYLKTLDPQLKQVANVLDEQFSRKEGVR